MDVSSVSAIAAAGGVIVGVVFAVLQLRDLVKTRQTDLVLRLYSTFNSKELREADRKVLNLEFKDFNDFEKKYGSVDSETPVHLALDAVSIFFDEVGVLVRRKLVDIGLVMDLFVVKLRWEKMKPLIEGARIRYGEPRMLNWFEYLYNESQRRRQKPQAQQ